jgi:hypothetical protein
VKVKKLICAGVYSNESPPKGAMILSSAQNLSLVILVWWVRPENTPKKQAGSNAKSHKAEMEENTNKQALSFRTTISFEQVIINVSLPSSPGKRSNCRSSVKTVIALESLDVVQYVSTLDPKKYLLFTKLTLRINVLPI